jgi:hypothetical protein
MTYETTASSIQFNSFNVDVRQEVAAAAHFIQLKFVHHLPLRGFVDVFLGQINDLFRVHAAGHLQSPHFAQVVLVFVGDDVAAREALDGDDHDGPIVSNCCTMPLFLNQFLKIIK